MILCCIRFCKKCGKESRAYWNQVSAFYHCCFTVVIHGNELQQAVRSYRVNSRAFPEQQPEPIIAHSQNYYKVNTHHKMRTKCHIHTPQWRVGIVCTVPKWHANLYKNWLQQLTDGMTIGTPKSKVWWMRLQLSGWKSLNRTSERRIERMIEFWHTQVLN